MSQKKKSLSQHSKARDHFFELCFNELLKVDFEKVKAVVIASPGFVKDEFFEIVQQKFQKEEYSKLKQYIPKFLPVHSSNGYLDALNEVLQDEKIKFKLKDTKALSEIKALESFYEAMKNDADKVAYGPKYVIEANENKVTNNLLFYRPFLFCQLVIFCFVPRSLKKEKFIIIQSKQQKVVGAKSQIFQVFIKAEKNQTIQGVLQLSSDFL
eukprot:TRINITY_DN2053_c0_g1_i1.p1 TRINITY_DN2053_c0_g1~~TRINITY_DN2053_c0_g1_i1.p1  ORF type:complete len:211 (-),score=23.23 TRINITY_DN2053_c0_g1_i1:176-808(-)